MSGCCASAGDESPAIASNMNPVSALVATRRNLMAPSSTDDGRALTGGPDPYALLILNQDQSMRPYDSARTAIGAEPVRFEPRPIFSYDHEVVRSGAARRDRCKP